MLYYDKIEVSEGIDINKTSASKGCDVCLHWYFLSKGFMFQPCVCNKCEALLIMSMNPNDMPISNIKGSDYHCIISEISKSEAIRLMKNIDMTEKS